MSHALDASKSNPLEGGATFSLRHRLFRALWNLAWFGLASWTPPFMTGWRRLLLRMFGASIAPTARIYGSARIWYPPFLHVAEQATIGPRVTVYCMAPISLGPYALVSQGAHLCAGTHAIDDPHFQLYARPITIGARAWIAAEAFVSPGVTVGEGAVLGARGVATDDLMPWTVYRGNPAVVLRTRRHTVSTDAR